MEKVNLYTDGSCWPNPGGPGGWAAILEFKGRHKAVTGGAIDGGSNNQMELAAVLGGIRALTRPCEVTIYTDSKNVIGWLYGWNQETNLPDPKKRYARKVIATRALCEVIDNEVSDGGHILSFVHIKGHSGHAMNEECDYLAERERLKRVKT
jgi:ribonuclease HI